MESVSAFPSQARLRGLYCTSLYSTFYSRPLRIRSSITNSLCVTGKSLKSTYHNMLTEARTIGITLVHTGPPTNYDYGEGVSLSLYGGHFKLLQRSLIGSVYRYVHFQTAFWTWLTGDCRVEDATWIVRLYIPYITEVSSGFIAPSRTCTRTDPTPPRILNNSANKSLFKVILLQTQKQTGVVTAQYPE